LIGWRAVLWVIAGISAATAAGLFVMVRDPGRAGPKKGSSCAQPFSFVTSASAPTDNDRRTCNRS